MATEKDGPKLVKRISQDDSSDGQTIVGHDISDEFSVLQFNQLQSRVYVDQWDIPCLRAQALGRCILGAIHQLRADGVGVVDNCQEICQFIFVCLPDCITKLMTSQAVFNWDRDTLEGVHNVLELAVRLICEYLTCFKRAVMDEVSSGLSQSAAQSNRTAEDVSQESPSSSTLPTTSTAKPQKFISQLRWEVLRLLALIFDSEGNYHQLCRDRNGSTGTYSDPFNDWLSILSKRSNGEEAGVFGETLPSPKNYYLVNLINCFGAFGGFDLLHWLGTQPWANINLLASILLPLTKCSDFLTNHTLQNHCGLIVMQRALWYLTNPSEDDFKDRDSRIFEVVTSVRVLTYRLSDLGSAFRLHAFLTDTDPLATVHSPLEPDWQSFPFSCDAPTTSTPSSLNQSTVVSLVDQLHCKLLLSALSPPQGSAGASFNGRMLALRNLVEQFEGAKTTVDPVIDHTAGVGRRLITQPSSLTLLASENAGFLQRRVRRRVIKFDHLMTWSRESDVILKTMHNLDNTAYMTNLVCFFRLLGERLTFADLTTVWHRTTNQPEATVNNVLNLLTDVASSKFNQSQMHHLLYLTETSWVNLNRQAYMHSSSSRGSQPTTHLVVNPLDEPSHVRHGRARLLGLVGRIGIATKEGWKVDMCALFLWDLAHGNYNRVESVEVVSNAFPDVIGSGAPKWATTVRFDDNLLNAARSYRHPEPIEAGLAQQLFVLREFRCSGHEQRLRAMRWLTSAVENISLNSLTYFMLAYLKSLLELILRNFVGRAKRDNLNELIRSHDLITQVVASFLRYEKLAVCSHGDLLSADSQDELGFRHSDVIKRYFELLHYLLRNAEISLNAERAKALWENLIGHPRAAAFDREQCFTWFTVSLNFLESETQTMLFTKLVLKSNPAIFRSYAGFECFKALFEKVNLLEGRMKQVNKLWHVEKPDLIGLDFLWDLYLALPSRDASLDGVHVRPSSPLPTDSLPHDSQTTRSSVTSDRATPGPATSGVTVATEPNAVRLARQLLLDVHWGQLTPRLRRDAEACYRRFFDACRNRLESNSTVGRGWTSKRGVHSAMAETGQFLAALIVGPGPAGRAKHCGKTAARLALRRLLGLVYAYIQTVEDEMFGSRIYHPNWRPHGVTFRGWEMRLPIRVETLRPGQTTPTPVTLANSQPTLSSVFAPSDRRTMCSHTGDVSPNWQPVSLLVHSTELLSSVRDRANLISTAVIYANKSAMSGQAAVTTSQPTDGQWTASALYIGPPCVPLESWTDQTRHTRQNVSAAGKSDVSSVGLGRTQSVNGSTEPRPCSKRILDTVANRKGVGELGFQHGRILTIRLIASLNSRVPTRSGALNSTSATTAASNLTMSLASAGPSTVSLATAHVSDNDLDARAAAALNTTDGRSHRRPVTGDFTAWLSRKQSHASVVASANTAHTPPPSSNLASATQGSASTSHMPRGLSLLSLSSGHPNAVSTLDLTQVSAAVTPTPTSMAGFNHTSLPSLCMGEDTGVYELLLDLAESELTLAAFGSGGGGGGASTGDGVKRPRTLSSVNTLGLCPSFSLIHPIRLLLASLPTYRSVGLSRGGGHIQQSLYCAPNTLLKSTPYRTLYKLQILSAYLIPVDKSPWWDISPGCLLAPPSQLYFTTSVFCTTSASSASIPTPGSATRLTPVSQQPHHLSGHHSHVEQHTTINTTPINSSQMTDPSQTLPRPTRSDDKLFLSGDLMTESRRQSTLSAPSSPVRQRRRPKHFKLFGGFTSNRSSGEKETSSKAKLPSSKSVMPLVANVAPTEFIEPLVQLLRRQLPSNNEEMTVLHPIGLLSSIATPSTSSQASHPLQSTLSANSAWCRREVRHLCLQLLSYLLNPHGGNGLNPPNAMDSDMVGSCVIETIFNPRLATELLSALLEAALVSSGVAESLPQRSGLRDQLTSIACYQPNKDSRADVAGLIEVTGPHGQSLLYQDVEVAVQSIHLLFQCVMAYPNQFLKPFLNLDRFEEKLLRLLIYSPSIRVRNETARQLEHLSLLTSRYLRFGETCTRKYAPPERDSTLPREVCETHSQVYHPQLQHFLLRVLFQIRLPLYTTHLDLQADSLLAILMNSAEYFRVRSFLLGHTPLRLLKKWFKTDHVSIVQEELTWFRNVLEVCSNFTKHRRELTDCLLAGHLESARSLCAQTVACVISHSACVIAGGSKATFSVHGETNNPNDRSSGHNVTSRSGGHHSDTVPVALIEALERLEADPSSCEPVITEEGHVEQELGVEVEVEGDLALPISPHNVVCISAMCLTLIRGFLHFLIADCLFPAASHIFRGRLNHENENLLLNTVSTRLGKSTLSKELSTLVIPSSGDHRNVGMLNGNGSAGSHQGQAIKLLASVGPQTRRTAFDFLSFVCRMDVQSLERVVDLLIKLHHNHDPAQSDGSACLSSGVASAYATPENLSGRNSPMRSSMDGIDECGLRHRLLAKARCWDIQPALVGRADSGFVGLRNGGATCYMNAVLQQLFMQPGLAEALLSITDTDELDEQNILLQTQQLFGHLLESQLEFYDPAGFWKSFRPWDTSESVNPLEQHDAFDFFQALVDQLDEELKKLRREPFFQAIYQGIFLDSKFCDECEHRYDREEVFSAINLAVKGHDLHEALNQFVRGEVLQGDNAYYCERCRVKRRAVKRLSVHSLPPVLCLHLKRFDFDWDRQVPVKFSDRFVFPRELDMAPYMADSIQKLRPEAFFSPSSSTSSLLQREARGAPVSSKEKFHLSDNDFPEPPISTDRSETTVPKSVPSPADTVMQEPPKSKPPSHADNSTDTDVIHMKPATQQPNVTKPYLYRLVGIVIHSGQANSGHYYTFIKHRGSSSVSPVAHEPPPVQPTGPRIGSSAGQNPEKSANEGRYADLFSQTESPTIDDTTSPSAQRKRTAQATKTSSKMHCLDDSAHGWFRFNDTTVEPIELTDSLLEHECFGGTYKATCSDGRTVERRTRYWSAYLLFYERVDLNHMALRQSLTTKKADVSGAQRFRTVSNPNVGSVKPAVRIWTANDASPEHTALRFTLSGSIDNVDCDQITPPTVGTPTDSHGTAAHPAAPDGPPITTDAPHRHRSSTSSSPLQLSPPPPPSTVQRGRTDRLSCGSTCVMPVRVAQRIWKENWAFLRDRNVYARDYFDFIRSLCEGILEDTTSLRLQPQRGVYGTRLLAHFFFTSFACLHSRSKALISGQLFENSSMSVQALKDLSIQQNAEWLGLLGRLASTSSKACRWLMHYLCTSPIQPCLVYLLVVPKPGVRQQMANMLLTSLRAFYAFKETNILDATLTRLLNHLLSFLDSGIVSEHATEAGPMFAMLRGYAEMCPNACLHLANLKGTKCLLRYLIEPPRPEGESSADHTVDARHTLFTLSAPRWRNKLRAWTPAQHREMGNLYYLLGLLILRTNFDDYRYMADSINCPTMTSTHCPRSFVYGHILVRPQKETIIWLGLSLPHHTNTQSKNVEESGKSPEKRPSITTKTTTTHQAKAETPGTLIADNSNHLVGLYRLCEVLIRAYFEDPPTPSLAASALGTPHTDFSTPSGACASGGRLFQPTTVVATSNPCVGASASHSGVCATGVAHSEPRAGDDINGGMMGRATGTIRSLNQAQTTSALGVGVEDGGLLRPLIRQTMLHLVQRFWEASSCLIIALLYRISSRPQSELRHCFDLLSELLCLVDPLQNARIAATVDGLVNCPIRNEAEMEEKEEQHPATVDQEHQWRPRPNADPQLWAWDSSELVQSPGTQSVSSSRSLRLSLDDTPAAEDEREGNVEKVEDDVPPWPAAPKGLLELIITNSYQDTRRAYQCMKFIVQLSSENEAVLIYLSRSPERWEPAVQWLENLMDRKTDSELSAMGAAAAGGGRGGAMSVGRGNEHSRCGVNGVDEGDSGGLYMVVPSAQTSGSSTRVPTESHLKNASNESDEIQCGFQRTVSAQTTLREATRILSTMTSGHTSRTGLASFATSHETAQVISPTQEEDDEDEEGRGSLFLKLST